MRYGQLRALHLVATAAVFAGLLYLYVFWFARDGYPSRTAFSAARSTCAASSSSGGRRILVTGAAGFIGLHASLALAKRQSFAVIGVDNFNTYYPVSLKRARAAVLARHGIPVLHLDIADKPGIEQLFKMCNFTHVLHLAGQPGVRYALHHPFSYIQSNIVGTVTLLEVMKNQKPMPVIVYASSSSVYGLSRRIPFKEDDRADVPASLYAATKRSHELITHTYVNNYKMSATGLRFFTVYGPWGRPDMAVISFTRKIRRGEPVKVFVGPNNQTLSRDFTYIDDIVEGILGSIASSPPSSSHRIFNLGNSEVVNVLDMLRALETVMGKPAKVALIPRPAGGEVPLTNADVGAASRAFGYAAKTGIHAGLAKFYAWYKEYPGWAEADMANYVPD